MPVFCMSNNSRAVMRQEVRIMPTGTSPRDFQLYFGCDLRFGFGLHRDCSSRMEKCKSHEFKVRNAEV